MQNSFPISRSLPLRAEAYEGGRVYAYFDNLLPDGISIRQLIAARMHATSDQVFDLLEVVGRDCVGALQFIKTTDEDPGFVLDHKKVRRTSAWFWRNRISQ